MGSHISTLGEVTWGGRVRPRFQSEVWSIAMEAAKNTSRTTIGNMVSSSERVVLHFLDGGVSDTRGTFDASSGMRWFGRLATAYILYRLGGDARLLLKVRSIPTLAELTIEIERK